MIYLSVIIVYFLLVTGISFLTKKIKSSSDYLIAGRNLGLVTCSILVASEWLGGMSTIGVSEKAFLSGTLQPILYNISVAIGMVIIGFTVARHYREKKVHTVSEMLEHVFNKRVRHISAIAFLIAYIALAYVQMQACASVLSQILGISFSAGIIISAVVITLYTYFGGLHALAIASIIHVFVMFFGLGYAAINGVVQYGGISAFSSAVASLGNPGWYNPFSVDPIYALSLFAGGLLGGMAGQASIQPIFAAKSPKVAKHAAIVSAFIVAPFGILTATLGIIGRLSIPEIMNTKNVLTVVLTNPGFIHPVIGGLALAGVLAAILSTVGPVNFAIVTIATKDIYQGIIKKDAKDRQLLQTAKKLVILVNLITVPLAIIFYEIAVFDAAYISYAIRAIGAIVIILGIYTKLVNSRGVILAFIGGTFAIFVCMLLGTAGIYIDKTIGAIVSALIFMIIGRIKWSSLMHQS